MVVVLYHDGLHLLVYRVDQDEATDNIRGLGIPYMADIDAVNSTILVDLNKIVDGYRRSGAPVAVYSVGNTTVLRIASIEFTVTTMIAEGRPVSLEFSCKPVNGDVEVEIPIEGISLDEIGALVIERFRDHMDRLAEKGVHPACDLHRR
jgi:hypothetical protein